jgi:hypothetical protein
MRRLLLIAICLLCACVPTIASAASLVGYWYGQGYQPSIHEVTQFVAHRRDDGSFEIRFRAYKNCVLSFDQVESGTWMMVNPDTYRTVTTSINGLRLRSPAIDDYHIAELTDEHDRYVHLATGVEYSARRVDENFAFPTCEAISLAK